MSLRCLFGHALHCVAPLYNVCTRCGAAYFTDYFESRARGYTVRFRVPAREAKRAARIGTSHI